MGFIKKKVKYCQGLFLSSDCWKSELFNNSKKYSKELRISLENWLVKIQWRKKSIWK